MMSLDSPSCTVQSSLARCVCVYFGQGRAEFSSSVIFVGQPSSESLLDVLNVRHVSDKAVRVPECVRMRQTLPASL